MQLNVVQETFVMAFNRRLKNYIRCETLTWIFVTIVLDIIINILRNLNEVIDISYILVPITILYLFSTIHCIVGLCHFEFCQCCTNCITPSNVNPAYVIQMSDNV